VIYKFNSVPSKYQDILHKTTKKVLKFIWKHKRPQIARAFLNKKKKAGDIRIPNFNTYHEATVQNSIGQA
jgi:hypothetical protein